MARHGNAVPPLCGSPLEMNNAKMLKTFPMFFVLCNIYVDAVIVVVVVGVCFSYSK